MAVTGQASASFVGTQTASLDLGVAKAAQATTWTVPFTDGTGINQADRLWTDTRTLTASSSENLDLAGGLTDPYGATITFARIRLMLVRADGGNTNNVIVGGAASNPWATWAGGTAPTVTVPPGGCFVIAAPGTTGFTVTAATGDILKVLNSGAGTSVTYTIVLLGASV